MVSIMSYYCERYIIIVYTLFGRCLRYRPVHVVNPVAIFSRQAGLTMIFSYNKSDWTNGWNHFLQGGTLFLTPEYESTLDQDDAIALNPSETPMVTIRKRIRLGSILM